MPKKIPRETAEALIYAVQKRDCLYNTKCAEYRNRNLNDMAWKQVADETQCDVANCKSTWASLRATFNRNLASIKNLPSGSGAADKMPKWYLFQQMLFLKEYVSHGKMVSNLAASDSQESQQDYIVLKLDESQMLDNDRQMADNDDTSAPPLSLELGVEEVGVEEVGVEAASSSAMPSTSRSPLTTTLLTPTPKRVGKKRPSGEDPVQQAMLDLIAVKRNRPAENVVVDEDLNFLRGLLPYFRDLPRIKKNPVYAPGHWATDGTECRFLT